MTSLLITGYKAFEIGISTEKDMRINIIKEAAKRDLIRFLEDGVDWLVFLGNLGFESWVLDLANELIKKTMNFRRQASFSLRIKVKIGMKPIRQN